MADPFDAIEDHLKRAHLRIDKIFYKLDSNLHKRAKGMDIPFDQQCALDDINRIQEHLNELSNRFQRIQEERLEFIKLYNNKINELEKRTEKILK